MQTGAESFPLYVPPGDRLGSLARGKRGSKPISLSLPISCTQGHPESELPRRQCHKDCHNTSQRPQRPWKGPRTGNLGRTWELSLHRLLSLWWLMDWGHWLCTSVLSGRTNQGELLPCLKNCDPAHPPLRDHTPTPTPTPSFLRWLLRA